MSLKDIEKKRQITKNRKKDIEAKKLAQKKTKKDWYFFQVLKDLMELRLDLIYRSKPFFSSQNTKNSGFSILNKNARTCS